MIMNELLLQLEQQPYLLIGICAVAGYLIGSVSFARVVYFFVTKSTNYEPFSEPIPHTDEKFESDLISATWVTKKLGKKYGMITSLADMLKVALPTLAVKLLFQPDPYFLVIAICGIAGHNYPIYHKFIGGRGESPIIGALFVINWFGIFIANAASTLLGDITGSVLVLRWGWYVLLIFWYWIYFNNIFYVIFMILANFLFWYSMRHDLAKFQALKKKYAGFEFKEEDVSDFIVMGKGLGRFFDNYGLYQVVKRKFFKRKKNESIS